INFNSPTNTFLGEFVVGTNTIPISPFITTWKTTTGTITIPTFTGETYNYNITWTNLTNAGVGDGSISNVTNNYTIIGLNNNDTYKVEISGVFPRIYFNYNSERLKIQTIEQWGNIAWKSMNNAFRGCENLTYNAIDAPNLTNVTDMNTMFGACLLFNGNIGNWNTSNVTDMSGLFTQCLVFNQNISSWNTGNVTTMFAMFYNANAFNQNIGNWNVSNVTDMSYMFYRATSFNQNINNWLTNSLANMSNMFDGATVFNQPLNNWNTINVTNMSYVFANTNAFNQNINSWNTSNVTTMFGMFINAMDFNQPLDSWDTSNVTDMSAVFSNAVKFNQYLSAWNVTNVTNMANMFSGAILFNQNLGNWNIINVTNMTDMLNNTSMGVSFQYDNTLSDWSFKNVKPNINLGAVSLNYCIAEFARNSLISSKNWIFTGDVLFCPFVTTWVTTTNTITIPTTGTGYNYSIAWENISNPGLSNNSATGITGNYTITGLQNGDIYRISIIGNFPRIFFNYGADATKLRNIQRWGTNTWSSMANAFAGCSNVTNIIAADVPNLSNVTDMSNMFAGASKIDQDLSSWNVSSVTNMSGLFADASRFNGNISSWNVSNVTNMSNMFNRADMFNQNISTWNVSNVTNMAFMFSAFLINANSFNQNIGNWNVSNVTNMQSMFRRSKFNQNISNWNVSNVTDMSFMFEDASSFNQNIGNWNVSNVTDMNGMFNNADSFNQNIGSWNVGNVTNMSYMFANFTTNTNFNQNIGNWNVSKVTDMTGMFQRSVFNQDISNWNVSNVTNMEVMFQNNTSFNQNINNWDVTNVTSISNMFENATAFNQNIGAWNIINVNSMFSIFNNCGISLTNYDLILQGWAAKNVKPNIFVRANGLFYCNGATARNSLITTKNWTFSGDAVRCINVSTKRTNALVFNGSTQSAMTSSVITTATSNVSIEGWVNFNSTSGGNAVCIFYNGNNFNNGYGLYLISNRVHILFGGVGLIDTGFTPPLNTWTHLVLAGYGANIWAVYQNGTPINTYNSSSIAPTNNFRIGSNVNGTAEFLDGQVDEVRFWNIGLGVGQIRENMHLILDGSQVNLIGYYQINETSGNNVVDGISAKNITLNNVTRANSTLAVASGSFHRRNISVGMNNFTNANVAINFTTATFDEFVAYQLNDNPINGINVNNVPNPSSCYWIVRQFGTNAVAYNQMNFTLPASNTISATDIATPSNLKLYKRPDNAVSVFGASIANATTANNTTKVIEFAGLTQTSFSQFEISSTSSPLPVTLLGWRAERVERRGEKTEEVKLSWETATEINNKGFEIESSENAVSFTKIAFVDGAGNSNNLKNYQLTIENSNDAYYRLKQI
ncbi:MAG: BspA family leucine-rich repeat surface protein, partial [Cytophagales bacterium]